LDGEHAIKEIEEKEGRRDKDQKDGDRDEYL
jgi:hypothetical protein